MLRAEKQLAQDINALMRKAEILDAQEDRRYGIMRHQHDAISELPSRYHYSQESELLPLFRASILTIR